MQAFSVAIPKTQLLRRDTTVLVQSKAVSGLRIQGYHGASTLYVQGSYKAAAPTTGLQRGIAGVGTTTTSIVKPTGAANWTASDTALVGKLARITFGGGAPGANVRTPVIREILSNTTTALTIKAITGLDDTSVFEIVDCDTVVDPFRSNIDDTPTAQGGRSTCIDVADNACRVVFVGFKFTSAVPNYNVASRRNYSVSFYGCQFAADPLTDTVYSDDDNSFTIYDSSFTANANVNITNAKRATVARCYASAMAGVSIDRCHSVTAELNSTAATGNALVIKRANNATVDMAASTGGATAAVFETCQRVDITALTGTGNTGYGVDISKGGVYNLTGATITGSSGDYLLDGISHASLTWADASSYGSTTRWGSTILITGGANTTRVLDTIRAEGNFDVTAQGLVSGTGGTLQLGGRVINYGYSHWAFNDSLTAHAGGGQGSATALGYGENIVTVCASVADSAVLPSGAAIGGVQVFVKNLGASSLNVFPPVGGKINALATNTAFAIAAGASALFFSRSTTGGLDWVTG